MDKTPKTYPRPLATLVGKALDDAFKRQGFASREIVTRWPTIVGAEIADLAQPMKMQWPRAVEGEQPSPATLVLRVEGPAAIEIQHQSALIIERVNQFFGWFAVERLALRQAPLVRPAKRRRREQLDPEAVRRATAELPTISDEPLREALGRLGAAVKRK
jgi:hypothetical protein